MINILILSVGRRVELINCFIKAKEKLNVEGLIIGADMDITAPALSFCNKKVILPHVANNAYINVLINEINNNQINLVIPTIDTELNILATNKELIEQRTQSKILISDYQTILDCCDKKNTEILFNKYDLKTPKVYSNIDEIVFPVIVKPCDGSSSKNVYKAENQSELSFFKKYVNNSIIQQFVIGKEYTIDVFSDFNGKVITIVPRERIAVRGGEILKGRIVKDKEIMFIIKEFCQKVGFIGQTTIQLIKNNHGLFFLEINPRFGGGAPMSILAGANSCENIFRLLKGETLEYNDCFRDNIYFCRFDQSIEL